MNYHIERFGRRIGSVILLICTVAFVVWSQRGVEASQLTGNTLPRKSDGAFSEKRNRQSGFTEDKERNREEGITYTVDEINKEILTSDNGEICVKIPRWKEFTNAYLISDYGYETLHMSNDINYDSMTYELIATWDIEEAEEEIAEDFEYHYGRDNVLGDIYHMTVKGTDIYYLPCYEYIHSKVIKWHYIIWSDLGCGQFLKTELQQGMLGDEASTRAYNYETVPQEVTEPLNIEGLIESLYSNMEVCSAGGEPIPVVYLGSLPESDEKETYSFSFGTAREYKSDVYRETTVCSELIESLYEAVQAGNIQELLQRDAIVEKELSIAEKLDYIEKEETGKLLRYDSGNAYARGDIKAQKGIYIYGADTREHYFLSCQGNPFLCIVNRDAEREIESIVLYDFATPDYIGTVIRIDASSVRLCSYIRNEGTYGTEMPWYLYDNRIDSGKEYYAMLEQWKITEYLGEAAGCHVEDVDSEAYAREQELTQRLKDTYLNKEINMSWDRQQHDVTFFQSASEYGYYYTSLDNLYKVYGQPETLAMEAPISCATIQAHDFDEDIDIMVDKNGKAAICVEGRFFLLEKSAEGTEELRTWE